MRRNPVVVLAIWWAAATCLGLPTPAWSQEPAAEEPAVRQPRVLPGLQASGQVLLPNQWSLKPAGKQLPLGDFPVNMALHPSGPWAAILHAGYGEHEVVIVHLGRLRIVSRVSLDEAFYGLTFDPAGEHLYASGAEFEVVHAFDFEDGYLSRHRELPVADRKQKFVPTGLSIDAEGRTLFVANAWGHTVCKLPLDQPDKRQHLELAEGSYPYLALPSADGKRLFVSLWGQAAVAVIDLAESRVAGTWPTEPHPTEMVLSPDGQTLFVACANSNTVTVFDTEQGRPLEVISSALYPLAEKGSTPNSVALSPDGKVLFVANADNNNVAVFNVSRPGKSQSMGFVPVGWYPTSVRFHRGENRLLVANGKGQISKANRQGPNPLIPGQASLREYIGGLFQGTLTSLEAPGPTELAQYSAVAYQCSPLRADNQPVSRPVEKNHPIPSQPGGKSPIKHCLYVIKENRTYDQVFGDLPQGNGDPALCIFPEKITPNHHALAQEFVLLDNFYVESEVSADGHEWSMGAYATDYVEKTWPLVYRNRGLGKLNYPSEGGLLIAQPAGGYIWDRCAEANVTYRSYGEFISNNPLVGQPGKAKVKALEGHFDPLFRSYDLNYPDVKRTERFVEELRGFEQRGDLPQFMVLRLPNDHTYGTVPGKPTPTAMVADNDLALGQLVEAVSHSKFWDRIAIFVVEDDAQNGSDHVDAHRTVALVISPYTKRKFVDSDMYSTASMLRTMELILGLKPMSQFDAAARPMYNSFQPEPDRTPYRHRPVAVDMTAVNRPDAWGAQVSQSLDFSREDAADDLVLNDIVWRSVRGAASPMPPPVRASFVIVHGDDDEDEDEKEGDDDDDDADDRPAVKRPPERRPANSAEQGPKPATAPRD